MWLHNWNNQVFVYLPRMARKKSGCNRHGYDSEAKLANQEPNMSPRSHQMQCRPWPCQQTKWRFRELGWKQLYMPFLLWSCTKIRNYKWCALTCGLLSPIVHAESKGLLFEPTLLNNEHKSQKHGIRWQKWYPWNNAPGSRCPKIDTQERYRTKRITYWRCQIFQRFEGHSNYA